MTSRKRYDLVTIMTAAEGSLLGRWIADVPSEHKQTLEVTELVFHDDGQLEYIIWSGTVPQYLFMRYKSSNGYLHFTHVDTLNSIPFEITSDNQLALKLQRYPCVYRRPFEDCARDVTPKTPADIYFQIKAVFGRWRRIKSQFLGHR